MSNEFTEIIEEELAIDVDDSPVVVEVIENDRPVLEIIERDPESIVIIESEPSVVEIYEGLPQILVSEATYIVRHEAGEVIGGHRAVYLGADDLLYYATNQDLRIKNRILGVTPGAVSRGAVGNVQTFAEMREPSWNWDVNKPIFLGDNGMLVQTPPTSGFRLIVAFPVDAKTIFISVKEPIILQ